MISDKQIEAALAAYFDVATLPTLSEPHYKMMRAALEAAEKEGLMSKNDGVQYVQTMSLRDWFAGQALACFQWNGRVLDAETAEHLAATVYLIADAMLKVRDEQ